MNEGRWATWLGVGAVNPVVRRELAYIERHIALRGMGELSSVGGPSMGTIPSGLLGAFSGPAPTMERVTSDPTGGGTITVTFRENGVAPAYGDMRDALRYGMPSLVLVGLGLGLGIGYMVGKRR